jgi:hypothetical protein
MYIYILLTFLYSELVKKDLGTKGLKDWQYTVMSSPHCTYHTEKTDVHTVKTVIHIKI